MKIIKFFTILFAPLVIGVFSCILILKVCNINFDAVVKLIASKIPVVNNFVPISSNTGLYAISQVDQAKLVTSSYNVDFLVSFYQNGKKTILLYPYEVEAGVDLTLAEQSKQDSLTVVTLPNAHITKANLNEKKDNYVIREQVDISSNYNNLIVPLKTALERRAKDLAISSGILAKANQGAEDYLKKLFPQNFIFQKEEAPLNTLKEISAPHLPITFSFQDKNFTDGHLTCYGDTLYRRDDLKFKDIKFGYLSTVNASFAEVDQVMGEPTDLSLRIVDPLNPTESRIYAEADRAYNTIFLYYKDGTCYYLESDEESKEKQLQDIAPDMLYLALSAKQDGRSEDYYYKQWLNNYENALDNMKYKRYQEASIYLNAMAKLRSTEYISFEEVLMDAYIRTKNERKFYPTNQNDQADFMLKAIYAFDNKRYNEMDDEFQSSLLSLGDGFSTILKKNRIQFLQLFYNLKTTSINLRNKYKNELLQNVVQYDHSIALSLQGQDYCDYVHKVLFKNDNGYDYYITNSSHPNLRIIGYEENLIDNEFNGFDGIVKIMKKESVLNDNVPQLVIAFITKSLGGLFKQHNLAIFEKNHFTLCYNSTGEWQEKYNHIVRYDDIESNPINHTFTIKGKVYKGEAIAILIQQIKNGINGYNPDFTIEELSKKLTDELGEKIYTTCYR